MKKIKFGLTLVICCITVSLTAQTPQHKQTKSFFIIPEVLIGKTMEANTFFPERKLKKGLFVSVGSQTTNKEWASQLNYPKTGFSLGVVDFGNIEKIGKAFIFMPFIEFGLLKKKFQPWHIQTGFGISYVDRRYDKQTNPFNKAITTKFNWSYRSFLYYDFLLTEQMKWRVGLGYLHQSNGHTRLPNQGLNSVVLSLSSAIDGGNLVNSRDSSNTEKPKKVKTSQTFFSVRSGIGQNVLSEVYNAKKEVYAFAVSAGTVRNKMFKFGAGFYYRFYEQYYDFIKNDREYIDEQVPFFKEKPFLYASNYGLFSSAELLINHIGIEFNIGVNIFKPFYKIDWQISQGNTYNDIYYPGELDWYYEVKRTISSRMGVKLYLINTRKSPVNNLFVGAHINSNLGQADFSELSVGYIHQLRLKKQKG